MTDQVKFSVNEVDDSQIQKSSILKIFLSNDSQMLDDSIGDLDHETLLLAKKLITILVGKKRGFFGDKAISIITDPKFLSSLFNGYVDIDRLKMMLKFEIDNRVDNSFDVRAELRYVTIEELIEVGEKTIADQEDELTKLTMKNNQLSNELSHYEDKIVISKKFLKLKFDKSLTLDLYGILEGIIKEVSEILSSKDKSKIFEYLSDIEYILYLIQMFIHDVEYKNRFLDKIEQLISVCYTSSIIHNFHTLYGVNSFIDSAPEKVEDIKSKIAELRK